MGAHLARATILFDQERWDLAEQELLAELTEDPDNPLAHALLALCFAEKDQLDRATDEARRAIAAAPDLPFAHRAHASVLMKRNRLDEALVAASEAVRLDPSDPGHHALVGAIQLGRQKWPEALAAAELGLAQDPESVPCTNVRASALVHLGRRAEAGATLESALARDPERPETHANRGWVLLHQGDPKKALEHFREALTLDPTSDWARAGLVEALKAHYKVYALLLRYFLWMARLGSRMAWTIVVGGYIGYRILLDAANTHPAIAPYAWPILIAYIVFAVMTWLAMPLFNLLLRLNKYGRHALSRDQTVASNWIGASLALTLVSIGVWLFTREPISSFGVIAALTFGPLVIPLSGTFVCPKGWPRAVMAAVTIALFTVRVAGVVLGVVAGAGGHDALAEQAIDTSTLIFFYGILGSQFLANALVGTRVKR